MSLINSRFRTAIHALAVIAYVESHQATSDEIATSVATDPTVIRRLLSALRTAGIVQTVEGRSGGYALARSPERISLLEIFRVVGPAVLFAVPERNPNPNCPVGAHIHEALNQPLEVAYAGLESGLASTSLADVMQRMSASR